MIGGWLNWVSSEKENFLGIKRIFLAILKKNQKFRLRYKEILSL